MAASVQCRGLGMMVMKEREDDLALFLDIDFDGQLGTKQDSSLIPPKITSTMPADDFLDMENDRTGFDWLVTPPLEKESKQTITSEVGISNDHPAVPKSELTNPPVDNASSNNETSKQPVLSNGSNASVAANRRQTSSGVLKSTASRSATPTGRATLPAKTKPSRSSTPTLRATLPSTKPTAPPSARSSTPTRSTARSSTPTGRPSVPSVSKSTSRSATPTSKNPVTKLGPSTLKNPVPSRGASPTVKSRPFSHDASSNLKALMPQRPVSASRGRPSSNLKALMPQRPVSASRGRPVPPVARSSSRGRASNGGAHISGSDDVNPVLIGTKMVERVVNMRKLAPPKQDGHFSKNNSSEKSSSQENSGFGRTLSKSSLDMALRHMDIRRTIPGNLRPLVTKVAASSVYGSGSTKSRTDSFSDSPLATSSSASSEPSVNGSSSCLDGSEVEDSDIGTEKRVMPR